MISFNRVGSKTCPAVSLTVVQISTSSSCRMWKHSLEYMCTAALGSVRRADAIQLRVDEGVSGMVCIEEVCDQSHFPIASYSGYRCLTAGL